MSLKRFRQVFFVQNEIRKILSLPDSEVKLRLLAKDLGCALDSTYYNNGKHLTEEVIRRIQEAARTYRESYIAIFSTTVIAVCALFVSIWQGIATRQHNKLSVRPYLAIRTYTSEHAPNMGICIENNGVGPAIIKESFMIIGNEYINICSIDKAKEAAKKANIFVKEISFWNLPERAVIKEGQKVWLINFPEEQYTPTGVKNFIDRVASLRFKIVYESIYKERFEIETEDY